MTMSTEKWHKTIRYKSQRRDDAGSPVSCANRHSEESVYLAVEYESKKKYLAVQHDVMLQGYIHWHPVATSKSDTTLRHRSTSEQFFDRREMSFHPE